MAGSHTYAEEGSDPITVTVTDDGGKTTTITGTATVADAALTGSSAARVSGTEGASATLTGATFTDGNPGNNSADFTAIINWGDSTTPTLDAGPSATTAAPASTRWPAATPTRKRAATPITVTVTDDGGKTTTITGTATVADAALTAGTAARDRGRRGGYGHDAERDLQRRQSGRHGERLLGDDQLGRRHDDAHSPAARSHGQQRQLYGERLASIRGRRHVHATVTINDDGGKRDDHHRHGDGGGCGADRAGTATLTGGVEGATAATLSATFSDANPGATASDFSGTINWGDGTATQHSPAAPSRAAMAPLR